MIAEPYINTGTGEIHWVPEDRDCDEDDIAYADFEREKLRGLGLKDQGQVCFGTRFDGYTLLGYTSLHLIAYSSDDYVKDSESNRLLKRAEFLKAVCEKEGVAWLPQQKGEPKTMFEVSQKYKAYRKRGIFLHDENCERCDPHGMYFGKIIEGSVISTEEREWRKVVIDALFKIDHKGFQHSRLWRMLNQFT